MRVIVVGAGAVGSAAIESLSDHHQCVAIDLSAERLKDVSDAFDVRVVQGDGAGREALEQATVGEANLVLACTARDEANLVTAMLVRRLSNACTVVRTADMAYLETWRSGDLDVDFIVSSEFETASAVARVVGVPGARQADFFLDGEIQVLEFDLSRRAPPALCERPLSELTLPLQSRVVAIVREGRQITPDGHEMLLPGDRVIVIGSRAAARQWSGLLVHGDHALGDVALFGGARLGATIARVLLDRGIRVRLIVPDPLRARELSDALPRARIFNASGFDRGFLRRERIGQATAAVFALSDDAESLYAAVLARVHGAQFTIAILKDREAAEVFDSAGIDAAIDPAAETAEVMVRFAHDPRISQIAMLDEDRFEVLDIEVRSDSRLVGRPLEELSPTSGVVGAIVRAGETLFPDGEQQLRAGDRVIVLAQRRRVGEVERAL